MAIPGSGGPTSGSERRSYADQYLQGTEDQQSPERSPYGSWYVDRLQRVGDQRVGDQRVGAGGPQDASPYPGETQGDWGPQTGGPDIGDTAAGQSPSQNSYVAPGGSEMAAREGVGAWPDVAGKPHKAGAGPHDPAGTGNPGWQTGPEIAGSASHAAAGASAPPGERPGARQQVGARPQAPQWTVDGSAPQAFAATGALSDLAHRQLARNNRELSLVEGNLLAAGNQRISSVYMASCFRGEGKTTAALSSAYGLAIVSQSRVLLVDASFDNARLHKMLSLPPAPGFRDVLDHHVDLSHALHPTDVPRLHFLAAGSPPNGAAADSFLGQRLDRIQSFFDEMKRHYDFIVVDGTSALASSDAARLAPCFDGVVFVVECERTKWEVVQNAVEKVRSGGGTVLGAVLNRRRFYIPRLVYQWISR